MPEEEVMNRRRRERGGIKEEERKRKFFASLTTLQFAFFNNLILSFFYIFYICYLISYFQKGPTRKRVNFYSTPGTPPQLKKSRFLSKKLNRTWSFHVIKRTHLSASFHQSWTTQMLPLSFLENSLNLTLSSAHSSCPL